MPTLRGYLMAAAQEGQRAAAAEQSAAAADRLLRPSSTVRMPPPPKGPADFVSYRDFMRQRVSDPSLSDAARTQTQQKATRMAAQAQGRTAPDARARLADNPAPRRPQVDPRTLVKPPAAPAPSFMERVASRVRGGGQAATKAAPVADDVVRETGRMAQLGRAGRAVAPLARTAARAAPWVAAGAGLYDTQAALRDEDSPLRQKFQSMVDKTGRAWDERGAADAAGTALRTGGDFALEGALTATGLRSLGSGAMNFVRGLTGASDREQQTAARAVEMARNEQAQYTPVNPENNQPRTYSNMPGMSQAQIAEMQQLPRLNGALVRYADEVDMPPPRTTLSPFEELGQAYPNLRINDLQTMQSLLPQPDRPPVVPTGKDGLFEDLRGVYAQQLQMVQQDPRLSPAEKALKIRELVQAMAQTVSPNSLMFPDNE